MSSDDITGEFRRRFESMTLAQAARGARWLRIFGAAAVAIVAAAGTALALWYEPKRDAAAAHEALAKATAQVAIDVRLTERRLDSQERQLEQILVQVGAIRGQLWLISEHLHVQQVPATVVPEKE
jgi:methylthioribose-1-phosphate isomerase